MTYDCLLEREAWLGGGRGHTMGGGGGGLRRGDAAPYIGFYFGDTSNIKHTITDP